MAKKRVELKLLPGAGTSYFVSDKPKLQFVSSGCTVLDCALGGGYCLGRMANIVGDKSTAKTALATEAIINFLLRYKGAARYCETEAAFDMDYAAAMGMPVQDVDFGDPDAPITTVEDFARDFDKFLERQIKLNQPGIYVVDSLDALSDEAEMERELGAASFGTAKAKALSEFFRTRSRQIERSKVLLLIISQVRDNIGAMFGEKHKRSGGRAMDFYASQVMWLAHLKTLKRTLNKVERPTGVLIKANIKKNKVALPFRQAEFKFFFGFGVDDIDASATWLNDVGRLSDAKAYKDLDDLSDAEYRLKQIELSELVKTAWREIETTFLPKRKKYE